VLLLLAVVDMLDLLVRNEKLAPATDAKESRDCFFHDNALEMVKDMVFLTSFLCTSGAAPPSKARNTSPNKWTPMAVLIAIAPFWALLLLLTQQGTLFLDLTAAPAAASSETTAMVHEKFFNALMTLLCHQLTANASKAVVEEGLSRISQIMSLSQSSRPASSCLSIHHMQLFVKLRKLLRVCLCTPLHFAVHLMLSMRTDLSQVIAAVTNATAASVSTIAITIVVDRQVQALRQLKTFEDTCVAVTKAIVQVSPLFVMSTDHSSLEATPLIYVAAYRVQDYAKTATLTNTSGLVEEQLGFDPRSLSSSLSLRLCKTLCYFCPSALAIGNKFGMFPLHFAARRGSWETMVFICTHFPFTCPLKDNSGKFALHHAVLSRSHHTEESIAQLARMYPSALSVRGNITGSFSVMHYVEKNCSESLCHLLENVDDEFRDSWTFRMANRDGYSVWADDGNEGDVDSLDSVQSSLTDGNEYHHQSLPEDGLGLLSAASDSLESEGELSSDFEVTRRKRVCTTVADAKDVPSKYPRSANEADASILLDFVDSLKMISCANSP
jgi:hypothetical protein